ncbi:hypothetical protein M1M97_00400 [Thermodesulfovibrionales bacterium]|nr:hypothetical protein [Thermodesulfovibrionales bacterium]MCL0083765.1 hypothetical protein [Thermodesulfovibrionales bacterium]
MKFNKTSLLVVVVMVLALSVIMVGCLGPVGPGTPDFLEVGTSYTATFSNGECLSFTVVEIRNDGWILAEAMGEVVWINSTQAIGMREK